MDVDGYALLRPRVNTKICGGEIMTTAAEMCRCVERNVYDFVQPDATVIGGIGQVLEVFAACRQHGSQAVVHCWGGAVCMMANYHAAFAGGGQLAEWPLPEFAVRQTMMTEPLAIAGGNLIAPATPGLGVKLTPEIEAQYPFREEALYTCLQDLSELPPDRVWEAGARQ
jgi:L-alanine-DL-glutamate epimerase-like enolase superfamily enzyme